MKIEPSPFLSLSLSSLSLSVSLSLPPFFSSSSPLSPPTASLAMMALTVLSSCERRAANREAHFSSLYWEEGTPLLHNIQSSQYFPISLSLFVSLSPYLSLSLSLSFCISLSLIPFQLLIATPSRPQYWVHRFIHFKGIHIFLTRSCSRSCSCSSCSCSCSSCSSCSNSCSLPLLLPLDSRGE
jgi:hypothetical protein